MKSNLFPVILGFIIVIVIVQECLKPDGRNKVPGNTAGAGPAMGTDTCWRGRGKYDIPLDSDSGRLIWYGRELIVRTAYYLGPMGTVAHISNGMNCQNCHLDAGTVPFGNNFGKVFATYPLFRARNNGVQSVYDRINDCLERSLNGQKMDTTTREMRAMCAYLTWIGNDVPRGTVKKGTGILRLKYMDRPADSAAGKKVYIANCQSCHASDGQGKRNADNSGYDYPPLWGPGSYNDGAGMYRLGSFAGFVKTNMPFGTDYHHPILADQQAWDVAAFVNSQPRPHMDQSKDWKNTARKPVDFPFGPYADSFSEKQHKFGPFIPIEETRKHVNKN